VEEGCRERKGICGALLGFGGEKEEGEWGLTLRVGFSFISTSQALNNLLMETGSRSFEEVKKEGEEVWNSYLGRFSVEGGSPRDRKTFFTSLYRALLFPRKFHEINMETGEPHHYNPFSGRLAPGILYTDNGFWDTHRTVYPFLALAYPSQCREIIEGWINAAKLGTGWFPQWSSPGSRAMMVGTHSDAVLADAATRGIPFDLETAYRFARRNATEVPDPKGTYGRRGLAPYLRLGYIPSSQEEYSVSRTNDYAYNDFCLAQLAKVLGREEDYRVFGSRAFNYRNLFDPSVGFMRGRNEDGTWKEPFDPFSWGGDFVEGSAWQHLFAVPHDPAGLASLFGGNEKLCEKLDEMLSTPPYFDIGTYWTEIHEMTEMAAQAFGQYAHSNQPVHHVLYLFAAAGQPWKTEFWVREVMRQLHGPEPTGLCGDEDNGEMSCWFLLSSMGLFPLCPGHPSFVLGSPLFRKVTLCLENGKELVIEAPGNGEGCVYVQKVEWNGQDYSGKRFVPHSLLVEGGCLVFNMSSNPNKDRPTDPGGEPFSFSKEFYPEEQSRKRKLGE